MNILLTGAAGFTGHFFKQAAEAAGHTVWPLAANLTDKAAVAAEVTQAQPTAVVHLAAISFVGHADEAAFYAVNVLGTMNLLAAVAALPVAPTKVLLASSANVYGNCAASPITEAQAPVPVNHYATSKLAMEHMALTYADCLPIVITRPFNYTGPGQAPQFLIPKLVSHFAHRADRIELGNLHVEREFNDVRMVCEAYLRLLTQGQTGQIYNVCSGQPHTLQHVINTLERITGHTMAVDVNPAFVRANEVHCLCGSPAKLQAAVGPLGVWGLEDTLRWMLDSHRPT
jgi:nucleoside-diphosphate-sugar epimerase